MTSQQQIDQFKEISGSTDSNEATNFLESCNGNLEQAINLFFSQQSRKKQQSFDSHFQLNSKQNISNRKTSEKEPLVNLSDDDNDDSVRAPIAPVQGPIIEQTFQQTYGSRKPNSNPIFEQCYNFRQMAEEQDLYLKKKFYNSSNEPNNSKNRASSSNGFRSSDFHNSKDNLKNKKDLKSLFRPPVEIIFKENWEAALFEAKRQSLWLIVNVQMAAEFSCQILNRDIWSKPTVKEVIQSNFLFWQVYHDSTDGVRVCSYYDIHDFPAIFIIDPRTGEKVIELRAQDPVSFLDQVIAFLERFPTFTDRDAQISGQANKFCSASSSNSNPSNNTSISSSKNEKQCSSRRRKHFDSTKGDSTMDDFSADIENSASVQAKRMKRINIKDDELNKLNNSNDNSLDPNRFSAPPSINEWRNYLGTPDSQSLPIQILLRFPDGQKQSVSLWNITKLKAIFILMAGLGMSMHQYNLVLDFPKRIFSNQDQEKSLYEVGFGKQEVIHIEKI